MVLWLLTRVGRRSVAARTLDRDSNMFGAVLKLEQCRSYHVASVQYFSPFIAVWLKLSREVALSLE